MYKSHRTQQMLNYFDPKDVRVRENPVTIDAQLLNIPSVQLDDMEQRVQRETNARFVAKCPAGIDSRGVYQAVRVPGGYSIPPEGTDPVVEGLRNGAWLALSKYDDRLPIPSRIEMDPDRQPVALSNPVLMDVNGSGDAQSQIWDVKSTVPGLLPIPNRLVFYAEGLVNSAAPLDIYVYGEKYPQSAWVNERVKSHEELSTLQDGYQQTKFPWAQIDKLVVKNLPAGARFRCWSMPFATPSVADTARPYTDSSYRDRLFPRFWSIDRNNFLNETFLNNNFVGQEYVQSYSSSVPLAGVAIEPHTWGMYLVSSDKLLYIDRREPVPDGLDQTGITVEPLYGIQVIYDQTKIGPTRYASISPYAYGGSGNLIQSRYLMQDPSGTLFVLLSDGSLAPYVASQGWRRGQPKAVSVPLLQSGTYIFSIECEDLTGQVSRDVFPYANLAVTPLATLSLATLSSPVQGVAFDHLDRLWIWNGSFAVPIKVHYDGFIVDRASNSIYLTDLFEQVRLS